jgi:methyltransferase
MGFGADERARSGLYGGIFGSRQQVTLLYWILVFVTLQRLCELVWAARNTARLRRLHATEADAGGYPYFIAVHGGWLAGLVLLVPAVTPPSWPLLAVFALLQPARLWVILSLGRYWTTRVLSLPGTPLVRTGPYAWIRHPNYLIVIAEIAILPLAFGAYGLAVAFSAINLTLIVRRIAIEDRILAPRRGL